MFTKEERRYYVENGVEAAFVISMVLMILAFSFLVIAIATKDDTYKEGYLQGQIDYRKGWINIKQDTLTNWKLK